MKNLMYVGTRNKNITATASIVVTDTNQNTATTTIIITTTVKNQTRQGVFL